MKCTYFLGLQYEALNVITYNWLSHADQVNYARALYNAKDMPMTQARIHALYGALD